MRVASLSPISRCLLMLCLVVAGCSATRSHGVTVPPALLLAHGQYEQAYMLYEQRIDECQRRQLRRVDREVFRDSGLDPSGQELAALVLAERALEACASHELGKLLIARGAYLSVAEHVGQRPRLRPDDRLIFDQHWKLFEREAAYAMLPSRARAQLEAIPALQQPFDAVWALDQIRGGR